MTQRSDATYHAALASPTRRTILDTLRRASVALDAEAIAGSVGVHVTTVRFHLEQLEGAGLVRRTAADDRRRGRPRLLFRPVLDRDRDERSREQLIEVLAAALDDHDNTDTRDRSIEAGRLWARSLVSNAAGSQQRDQTLLTVLDQLGFQPEPDGDTVQLHGCPFRDAARQHPQVVCAVHRGLILQILAGEDETSSARLLPFVESDLCVITSA